MKKKITKGLLIISIFFLLEGCAAPLHTPFYESAISGSERVTSIHKELLSIPEPEKKVPVAVYRFRDQTGQYKPPTTSTNFSTAVTQGATSILIKALGDSEWFMPVEREGLANLLQERRIALQMANQYNSTIIKDIASNVLQPLVFAGLLLEGGIIGYDSNIVTGGLGAMYFGAGGEAQYRVDRVTIYLRAVSVKNGVVLKSVQATKVILSQQISMSIFRFIRLNRLLEVEAGYTANEPSEMAVQEAIEKAVYDLIIEGAKIGMWKPKNPEEFKKFIEKYEKEKAEVTEKLRKRMDEFSKEAS